MRQVNPIKGSAKIQRCERRERTLAKTAPLIAQRTATVPASFRPGAAMIATTTGVAMQETEMKSPGRDAIEAYISVEGHICLRQTGQMEDEAIVMLLPHDIPQVIEWLQRLAGKFPLPARPA